MPGFISLLSRHPATALFIAIIHYAAFSCHIIFSHLPPYAAIAAAAFAARPPFFAADIARH
jgi:hypothetical protein